MSLQERVRMCRLIDKMGNRMEYTKRLGLENKSCFHGCPVEKINEKKRGNGK